MEVLYWRMEDLEKERVLDGMDSLGLMNGECAGDVVWERFENVTHNR